MGFIFTLLLGSIASLIVLKLAVGAFFLRLRGARRVVFSLTPIAYFAYAVIVVAIIGHSGADIFYDAEENRRQISGIDVKALMCFVLTFIPFVISDMTIAWKPSNGRVMHSSTEKSGSRHWGGVRFMAGIICIAIFNLAIELVMVVVLGGLQIRT